MKEQMFGDVEERVVSPGKGGNCNNYDDFVNNKLNAFLAQIDPGDPSHSLATSSVSSGVPSRIKIASSGSYCPRLSSYSSSGNLYGHNDSGLEKASAVSEMLDLYPGGVGVSESQIYATNDGILKRKTSSPADLKLNLGGDNSILPALNKNGSYQKIHSGSKDRERLVTLSKNFFF